MNLIERCIPEFPCTSVAVIYIVAILGAVLLVYGVFLEQEKRQDLVKMIGASALLVYALYIGNKIFIGAMAAYAVANFVEFLEIYLGKHKHTKTEIKDYTNSK